MLKSLKNSFRQWLNSRVVGQGGFISEADVRAAQAVRSLDDRPTQLQAEYENQKSAARRLTKND